MEGAENVIDTARERSTMLRHWLPGVDIGGLLVGSAKESRQG